MRVNEKLSRFNHFIEWIPLLRIFSPEPQVKASSVHRAIKYAAASACANTYFIV